MTLSDWLKRTKTTEAEFAREISTSRQVINHLIRGHNKPSLALLVRIERVTKGKVRALDFMDDEPTSNFRERTGTSA